MQGLRLAARKRRGVYLVRVQPADHLLNESLEPTDCSAYLLHPAWCCADHRLDATDRFRELSAMLPSRPPAHIYMYIYI